MLCVYRVCFLLILLCSALCQVEGPVVAAGTLGLLRLCQRLLPCKPEAAELLLRGLQLVPSVDPEVGVRALSPVASKGSISADMDGSMARDSALAADAVGETLDSHGPTTYTSRPMRPGLNMDGVLLGGATVWGCGPCMMLSSDGAAA
jgi:hypothetical protein